MGVFLEIILDAADLRKAGFEGRDAIEDPLDDALEEAGLGEVTGGGGGMGIANIDVEIDDDDSFPAALELIRQVLKDLGVPASSFINRYEPSKQVFWIYE